MARKELAIVTIKADSEMTLTELCDACHITPEWIMDLVSYGILELKQPDNFDVENVRRIRRLQRLQHDFELNLAGAVLASELIDHIETLNKQVELFKKYLSIR